MLTLIIQIIGMALLPKKSGNTRGKKCRIGRKNFGSKKDAKAFLSRKYKQDKKRGNKCRWHKNRAGYRNLTTNTTIRILAR